MQTADVLDTSCTLRQLGGGFGGSWQPFEDFDYNGWNHATDAQFLDGLTYNDESRMFHSSYGTVENDEFFEVGVSIPALSDYNGSASIKTKRGEWWDKASGRLELDNSLFDVITIGRGLVNAGAKATAMSVAKKKSITAISQFSNGTIDNAVELIMKDPNKLNHLFAAKHNLGNLVKQLRGQENVIRAILKAANGKLPSNGWFKDIAVNVGGQTVLIRGNVINGIPRLGTMYIL